MAAQATVIYPPGNAFTTPVNVEDSIEVTYTSDWAAVNLTVLCLGSATADDSTYLYYNVDDNPILANGSYTIPRIENMDFGIRQYPTQCEFRLTEFGDNANNVDGGQFTLTSTNGFPTTFRISTTILPTASAQTTSTGTTDTRTSTASETRQATSTTSSQQAETSSASSSSSDKPVTAAVAVGIALGAVALIIVVVLALTMIRRKRRRRAAEEMARPDYEKAELAGDDPSPPLIKQSYTMATKNDTRYKSAGGKDNIGPVIQTSEKQELAATNDSPAVYHELSPARSHEDLMRHELA